MPRLRLRRWIIVASLAIGAGVLGTAYLMQRGARETERIVRSLPELMGEIEERMRREIPPGSVVAFGNDTVAILRMLHEVGPPRGAQDRGVLVYTARWLAPMPDSTRRAIRSGRVLQTGLGEESAYIALSMDPLLGERAAALSFENPELSIPLEVP